MWFGLVLAGMLAAPLGGCGRVMHHGVQYGLQPGNATPGASGKVSVQQTDSNNQKLKIQVAHMPPPGELHPNLSHFVVWGHIPGQPQQSAMNLGQISIGRDREGTLEVVTPYPNLDLMITAESTSTPRQPSNYVVLQGQVQGGAAMQ
jgi:hypothetical protein